jgi:hypothetical protein
VVRLTTYSFLHPPLPASSYPSRLCHGAPIALLLLARLPVRPRLAAQSVLRCSRQRRGESGPSDPGPGTHANISLAGKSRSKSRAPRNGPRRPPSRYPLSHSQAHKRPTPCIRRRRFISRRRRATEDQGQSHVLLSARSLPT